MQMNEKESTLELPFSVFHGIAALNQLSPSVRFKKREQMVFISTWADMCGECICLRKDVRVMYIACMKSPTQAVSRTDVDLKDGHAAPNAHPRLTLDDNLINNTCSVNTPSLLITTGPGMTSQKVKKGGHVKYTTI